MVCVKLGILASTNPTARDLAVSNLEKALGEGGEHILISAIPLPNDKGYMLNAQSSDHDEAELQKIMLQVLMQAVLSLSPVPAWLTFAQPGVFDE